MFISPPNNPFLLYWSDIQHPYPLMYANGPWFRRHPVQIANQRRCTYIRLLLIIIMTTPVNLQSWQIRDTLFNDMHNDDDATFYFLPYLLIRLKCSIKPLLAVRLKAVSCFLRILSTSSDSHSDLGISSKRYRVTHCQGFLTAGTGSSPMTGSSLTVDLIWSMYLVTVSVWLSVAKNSSATSSAGGAPGFGSCSTQIPSFWFGAPDPA